MTHEIEEYFLNYLKREIGGDQVIRVINYNTFLKLMIQFKWLNLWLLVTVDERYHNEFVEFRNRENRTRYFFSFLFVVVFALSFLTFFYITDIDNYYILYKRNERI